MGNYAAIADLTARLDVRTVARLGSDNSTVNTAAQAATILADTTVIANINACITSAEETINGLIRGKVDITDTAIWTQCKPAAVNIALHYLYGRHGAEVPDDVLLNAQEAMRWARGVANGTIILQASPQIRSSQIRSINLDSSDYNDPVFSGSTGRNNMAGFTRNQRST